MRGAISRFTSQPIIQQELKRCRLRSVPYCTSVIYLLLALVYFWLFAYHGLNRLYGYTVEMRYDDLCEGATNCLVSFNVTRTLRNRVGLYYKLTKVHQMRREIASSFQSGMLQGEYVDIAKLSDCTPVIYINNTVQQDNLYIPCGLLAKTVFNDSFTLVDDPDKFSETGIALDVDRDQLFRPGNDHYENASHWLKDSGMFPEGQTNEHFIVWMRQSAFSPFRKLYALTEEGLEKGTYTMVIRNNYDTRSFEGEKWFVIAETGFFGTIPYGPAMVFGIMSAMFFAAAGILGWIGWNRSKPKSKFHPNQLKNIFSSSTDLNVNTI
jgi:hypothetical protein